MITHGVLNQHPTLTLDNGILRVVVLPQKGADIYALVHVPSGVDFLLKSPAGLRPPTGQPPAHFLENYEGGWQTLLPNGNEACAYRGKLIPFHGEAALLAWEVLGERDGPDETAVNLGVRCQLLPLRLERSLRLRAGQARLEVVDRVTNEGDEPMAMVWAQHLVLGGDFLEAGCRLDAPAHTILTLDVAFERQTRTLAEGQREPWPFALGCAPNTRVDLRDIPGPKAHTHDDALLTDFDLGYYTVTNPRLGLTFRLDWDVTLFPYIALWQPYGGASRPPELVGIYGIGLEPWVSRDNLADALQHGEALELAPGASVETMFVATVAEAA